MSFSQAAYEADFVKPLRRAKSLPDDLLERYGITPGMADAEIAQQLVAIRQIWNKGSQGNASSVQVYKMCRSADDDLRRQYGAKMETAAFWKDQEANRNAAAGAAIKSLSKALHQSYGSLGVITRGILDRAAESSHLSAPQADRAAVDASLTVLPAVQLPPTPPLDKYRDLVNAMALCSAASVPALVHPGRAPFTIVQRFSSAADASLRLDVAAVTARQQRLDKRGPTAPTGEVEAMRILAEALRKGVDLRDVALHHFSQLAQEKLAIGSPFAVGELEKAGLVRDDAAAIVITLIELGGSGGGAGADRVTRLIADGRLADAEAAMNALPPNSQPHKDAKAEVDAARARLDALLAKADAALRVPDEITAVALLKQAAGISVDDADARLKVLPPPPPANFRLAADGADVKLFWQPAQGHAEAEATYVVTRSGARPPVDPSDGTSVHTGSQLTFVDTNAPVGRQLHYAVFATVPDRPHSRPAASSVTLAPPVSKLAADIGTDEVVLHWTAHPAALEVGVHHTPEGGQRRRVQATRSGCRVGSLTEGQTHHFEVCATYLGKDGSTLTSAAEHISATPRAAARPVERLQVQPTTGGLRVGVKVSWTPVDSADVHIVRSDRPSLWNVGARVTRQDMADYGKELIGRRIKERNQVVLDCDIPAGVHHFVPFSEGGTGIVAGRSATLGITEPVRNLSVTTFSTYATVSWEWPQTAALAELTWEVDGEEQIREIGRSEYMSDGGVRVRLGRTAGRVEVRAVLMADRVSFTSPPVSTTIRSWVESPLIYSVESLPSLPGLGARRKRVVFTAPDGCSGVRVRLVAAPGRFIPKSPVGHELLDTTIDLEPGGSVEHLVAVPRKVKQPFWLRGFVVAGRARLLDPPVSALKEA